MEHRLCYCKKCGRCIVIWDINEEKCDFCGSQVFYIPDHYIDMEDKTSIRSGMNEQFMEDCVYHGSEFSPKMHQKLLEQKERERQRDQRFKLEEERNRAAEQYRKTHPGAVICPKCGSVSVTPTQYRSSWTGRGYTKNLCMQCGYKWTPGLNF